MTLNQRYLLRTKKSADLGEIESGPLERVFIEVAHELFKLTIADENGMGSHGELIGDTSRHEPWAFFLTTKSPRLPEKAVGMATKTGFS